MATFKREIVAGLDIGSSKILLIVAEVNNNQIGEIIGVAKAPSSGISQGTIVDIDKATKAIKEVLVKAEQMSGVEIDSVFVNMTGSHISSVNKKKVISISANNREITAADVDRVTNVADLISIPSNKEIIHVLPSEFIVDGCKGIKSPIGMSGLIMEANSHIVTADSASLQNLKKSVYQSGVEIGDIVLQSFANAMSVLSESEKKLGVVLVDIGAGTTDIAIFKEGNIKYTAVLETGGNNITSALAKQLKISPDDAERLKKEYGSAAKSSISAIKDIEFLTSDKREINISEKRVAEIIEGEISKIFKFIYKQVVRAGYKDLLPAGIVLTGGETLLSNLDKSVTNILKMPVRLGTPNRFDELLRYFVGEDRSENNEKGVIFSTGLGLVEYAAKNRGQKKKQSNFSPAVNNTLWDKIKSFFANFF